MFWTMLEGIAVEHWKTLTEGGYFQEASAAKGRLSFE